MIPNSYSPTLFALILATAIFPYLKAKTWVPPSYFKVILGEAYLMWNLTVIGAIAYFLSTNSEVTTMFSIMSPNVDAWGSIAKVSSVLSQGSITISSC